MNIYINLKSVGNDILRAIMATGEADLFDFALSAYVNLIRKVPENRLGDECEEENKQEKQRFYHIPTENGRVLSADYLSYWRGLTHAHIQTDAQFAAWFHEVWYEYLAAGQRAFYGLSNEDLLRAHSLALIPDDAVYFYFTAGAGAPEHIPRGLQPAHRRPRRHFRRLRRSAGGAHRHVGPGHRGRHAYRRVRGGDGAYPQGRGSGRNRG